MIEIQVDEGKSVEIVARIAAKGDVYGATMIGEALERNIVYKKKRPGKYKFKKRNGKTTRSWDEDTIGDCHLGIKANESHCSVKFGIH